MAFRMQHHSPDSRGQAEIHTDATEVGYNINMVFPSLYIVCLTDFVAEQNKVSVLLGDPHCNNAQAQKRVMQTVIFHPCSHLDNSKFPV